ncbi:hypothetical protein [Laspinema palackyanum]
MLGNWYFRQQPTCGRKGYNHVTQRQWCLKAGLTKEVWFEAAYF